VSANPGSGDDEGTVPYIAHADFARGLPYGHFHIVINPTLARPYVVQRTRVNVLAVTAILIGAVLALSGQALPGAVLVVLGIAGRRIVRHQAGKIALHLAAKDPAVYAEVTSNGVMEVRRAV
jgi:hypothetical protein